MIRTGKYRSPLGWVAGTALLLTTIPGTAQQTEWLPSVGWIYHQNNSIADEKSDWQKAKQDGYLPVDIETIRPGSDQYVSVWRENDTDIAWVSWHGLTSDEYNRRTSEYRDRGYLITDQDMTVLRGEIFYSLVMKENTASTPWISHTNIDSQQLEALLGEHREQYIPTDIDAAQLNGTSIYSVVMQQNNSFTDWHTAHDMSADDYQSKLTELRQQGYSPADIACYQSSEGNRYTAIWEKTARAVATVHGMSATDMRNKIRTFTDQGMRIAKVTSCRSQNGDNLFAAIWEENEDRYRWPARATTNALLQDYIQAEDIPGVTAAIVHNGKVLYQGGTGYASNDKEIEAHSGTVYRLASISKAIVGTLAFKLIDQGKLELDVPTRHYLPDLSEGHTHTVRELMRNTGCVKSYTKDDYDDNNTTVQYTSANEALKHHLGGVLKSDEWIIEGCTPGEHNYSTHGYTHLTAVLESAAGDTFENLVERYITGPMSMSTLGVEHRTTPVADGERAELTYKGNLIATNQFQNPSWKAGGSGMESSAIELALFGDAVLNNRYFSADVRDHMWSGGDKDSEMHGWSHVPDRAEMEKGGVNQGTDVHIRIDPASGVTVVAMTNTFLPSTRTPVLTEKLMDMVKKQLADTPLMFTSISE